MRILKPAILGLCLTFSAHSELTSSDRDLIKEMTRGELYLKNNVPCRFTSGMGIGAEVVTEVSPTEVDWDRNLKAIEVSNKAKKKRRGVDTIYWGFGPNDVIRYGKLYFKKGGVVELWAEGVKPKDVEVWIRFVGIQTREDFKKAYNLIASNKPIQEDNPDWPAEIRSAVRDRRVVEGMTKAQAFAVVGTPVGIEVNEEGGKKLETWFPRQETGASGDFGKVISSATGFPASLRFVDGKLLTISQSNRSLKVNLDK
jgi:hypothetical protein